MSYKVLDSLIIKIYIKFKDFSNFEFVELTNEKNVQILFKLFS
jgi:hypothetical protein